MGGKAILLDDIVIGIQHSAAAEPNSKCGATPIKEFLFLLFPGIYWSLAMEALLREPFLF